MFDYITLGVMCLQKDSYVLN